MNENPSGALQEVKGELENRLIYDPTLDQEYLGRMAKKEREIFDNLTDYQKTQYLMSAQQAWNYAELYYKESFYNGKGDAVRHAFWNALSTVYIGEELTEQLTTAHENIDYNPNYPNHYKETQMDFHNNAEGRQIAYGAGRLYQLVQLALDNGDLRYLNNLEYITGFWRATDSSQLTPTNQ